MKKAMVFAACMLCLMWMLAGCQEEAQVTPGEGEYNLYYTNVEGTGLETEIYKAAATDREDLIGELGHALTQPIQNAACINLLNDEVYIENYSFEEGNLQLNLSTAYGQLAPSQEILKRAGLVRTFAQLAEVDTVELLVSGAPLTDGEGIPYGQMQAQDFVENTGREINSYQNATITLYFTNETGDRLIQESRKLYYSSNMPLERVVVEQVLRGPKTEGNYPTAPATTGILGVTVVDGTCYVNLDKVFTDQALAIQEQIPIYSLVNSIIDSCSVSQVQIAVEGESNMIYRESMDLNKFYTKNSELIQTNANTQ